MRSQSAANGELSVSAVADDYAAHGRDRSRMRFKTLPVFALAFGAAYLAHRRLKPKD
jgi:hypothetical protein